MFLVENFLGGEDFGVIVLRKVIENEVVFLWKMEEEFFVLWFYFEEEILKCRDYLFFLFCVCKINLKCMME